MIDNLVYYYSHIDVLVRGCDVLTFCDEMA